MTAVCGNALVPYQDGARLDLAAGMVFHISNVPQDSSVEGEQAYVSLHVSLHALKPP